MNNSLIVSGFSHYPRRFPRCPLSRNVQAGCLFIWVDAGKIDSHMRSFGLYLLLPAFAVGTGVRLTRL